MMFVACKPAISCWTMGNLFLRLELLGCQIMGWLLSIVKYEEARNGMVYHLYSSCRRLKHEARIITILDHDIVFVYSGCRRSEHGIICCLYSNIGMLDQGIISCL
jgi:hypothetical protein